MYPIDVVSEDEFESLEEVRGSVVSQDGYADQRMHTETFEPVHLQ